MDATSTGFAKEHVQESDAGNLIDLSRIFALVRRRQWTIVATFGVVLALTAIAYFAATPRYTATARVALDRQVVELVGENKDKAPLATDSPSVDTEVQVLTSPRIAAAVVDRLGLARVPGIGQPKDAPPVPLALARETAIDRIRNSLDVKREGTSYAIKVGYSSPDPRQATAIVNAAIEQYVNGQLTSKAAERSRETALLRERLEQLRGEVIRSEAAVARYRAATNLIDVEKDSTAAQQEISVLNTQLAGAQAEQAAAEARLNAARGGAVSSDSLGSPLIKELRGQQAQLSAQKADLTSRYGELHPSVARINRQIEDVSASINQETARIRAGLQADAQVARGRSSSIQASLGRSRGALLAGNNASVQLNELQRNADSSRGLYQSLLDRYRQNVTAEVTERSNAYIIAPARTPFLPDSPDPLIFLVGGIVAGILAAATLVLVLEIFEHGMKTRAEVETKLGIPVLASAPDLATMPGTRFSRRDPMAPADFLVANQGSMFSEAFRSIRTALLIGQDGQRHRSVAVCSALPDEGKTTTAVCLARSSALAGLRVLLVDCDLRRRASSRTLADQVEAGLVEVLKNEASIEQALVRDTASGAWVLPQKPSDRQDYDVIASRAMANLVATLSESFDLIVLDTAPILPLAEARAIAAMADSALLVVRWRETPVHAARLALDQLGRAGANVAGAVISRVDVRQQSRAGLGDEMLYYKKYKEYYT